MVAFGEVGGRAGGCGVEPGGGGRGGAGFAVRPGLLLAAAGVCGFITLASFAVGTFRFAVGAFRTPVELFLLLSPVPLIAALLLVFPVWVLVWKSGWRGR